MPWGLVSSPNAPDANELGATGDSCFLVEAPSELMMLSLDWDIVVGGMLTQLSSRASVGLGVWLVQLMACWVIPESQI